MMRPAVAEIVSRVLVTMPTTRVTDVARGNYDVFKRERVRSCYQKIVNTADQLERRSCCPAPLAARAAQVRPYLARLDYKELIGRAEIDERFKQVKDRASFEAFAGYVWDKEPSGFDPIFDQAAKRGVRARAEALVFRLLEALSEGGYPLFWTLTVDPRHEHVIGPRRDEFKLWLRKVRRRFGAFQYCAVTERGELGRLHIHCLFIFEKCNFSDPNSRKPGKLVEPPELRGYWPYGFSNPVVARVAPADCYGMLRWRWPQGQSASNHDAIARYMAGYITKPTYEVDGCRTKMTRGFGLTKMSDMTPQEALLILTGDSLPFLKRIAFKSEPPKSILRAFAVKRLFGKAHLLPSPPTKLGSVSEASKTLALLRSSRLNAGDSINPVDGFDWELNPYLKIANPVRIGLI